ncbi:MAG TPA: LuxR C-terminal-related transcriptional regulator [Aggregatilineales bacterium]|nr:LuxR C-terminal-related transcriptional regulator [Aggregatilineales bacterium]
MASQKRQAQHEGLSERELDILLLLEEGLSDREIAERMVMTINTVKWYNRQIYSKLGVGNRTQAVAHARALRLLEREDDAGPPFTAAFLAPKHNLPVETTRFIGRTRETTDILRLLGSTRLLTLTGPPGAGKTRLSIHVAREMTNAFQDGVYLVSLAPITDPALVANAIARAIGVNETPGQPVLETLKYILRDRQTLLVVDNFEHLLPAAPLVSELLAATSRLQVLATSREALRLYGEKEYTVPLLELPDPHRLDPVVLATCESVALFVERARGVRPDFELTIGNALDIAKICVRLEGLPLAIELAAARVKLMIPKVLLARLSSRLETLVGGPRDVPLRQQTLRQTIDWSYNLLNAEEKTLFARLAVFRGGRNPEAIEAVCQPGLSIDPLEGTESLLNKSLLFLQQRQQDKEGEPRFIMLETIHEYAWAQLQASGEAEAMRRRHAEYFAALGERAEPELRRAGFSHWMARLESESENLRAALEWSLGGGDVEIGLRLIAALRDYWIMSSRYVEGEEWLRRALPKSEGASPNVRAKILSAAGAVLFYAVQRSSGKQFLEEAIELAREVDDRLTLAWALIFLGAFAIGQAAGYEEALACTEEGLTVFRELNYEMGVAQALNIIGELMRTNGDDEGAQVAYEECLSIVRETGETRRESMCLANLGFIAMHQADISRAESLFRDALIKLLKLDSDRHLVISCIVCLAGALGARGEPQRAVRLFGAAEALLEPIGVRLAPGDLPEYERSLDFVRSQLDAATFDVCWNEGRALSFEQVVNLVLDLTHS